MAILVLTDGKLPEAVCTEDTEVYGDVTLRSGDDLVRFANGYRVTLLGNLTFAGAARPAEVRKLALC